MDDLSNLTDEELQEKIEPSQEIEESSNNEATTEEEVVEQEAEQEVNNEPSEEVEQAQEEERPPSRREQLRIQQLLSKLKETEAPQPNEPKGLDYSRQLDADQEVISQLEQDRRNYGQNLYNQGLEQAKSIQFHTRLEIDAPKVEAKYSQLNPNDKNNFNPVVATAINEWYLATTGYDAQSGSVKNSDIRYADFVDGIMELSNELASQKNISTAKNIAKQSAQTGLRPDGSSSKRLNLNKAPQDMTNEELEAFLAKALPSR